MQIKDGAEQDKPLTAGQKKKLRKKEKKDQEQKELELLNEVAEQCKEEN